VDGEQLDLEHHLYEIT